MPVKAIDEDKSVVFEGTVATMQNGFFELWLPRNRKITLSMQYGNLSARGIVETFSQSKTCETTFKLQ